MVEFNTNLMTNDELMEAANRIFTAQEKDFEKIKSEKWYQSLFHAITLNQDGKKYAVRGIRSLSKLQQLFMSVYIRNYRENHKQLQDIIESVIKNSEAIKKLYGQCVLNIEEQASLSSLDAFDAEILTLFLGEYRDSKGNVPDKVQAYNRGVLTALRQQVPNGTLKDYQIRKLKNPKIVYRCFMEQCAIDGTMDSQDWSDKIYEDLRNFEISEYSKREIRNAVKYEVDIAGVDYLLEKYSKENNEISDSDFEIDDSTNKQEETCVEDKQKAYVRSNAKKPFDHDAIFEELVGHHKPLFDLSSFKVGR